MVCLDKIPTFVICLFVFIFCSTAFADEEKDNYFEFKYAYYDIEDRDYRNDGDYFGLGFIQELNKNFRFEFESGYVKFKSKAGTQVSAFPFLLNTYSLLPLKIFSPYLVAGLGFMHFEYRDLGSGDRKDNNNGYCWNAGLGIERAIDKNLSFKIESSYLYGNTGGNSSLDIYGWRYALSLQKKF